MGEINGSNGGNITVWFTWIYIHRSFANSDVSLYAMAIEFEMKQQDCTVYSIQ
jgi:hypothetical protein